MINTLKNWPSRQTSLKILQWGFNLPELARGSNRQLLSRSPGVLNWQDMVSGLTDCLGLGIPQALAHQVVVCARKVITLISRLHPATRTNHGPNQCKALAMDEHTLASNKQVLSQPKTQSGERNLETYTLITGESDVRNVTCINELSVSGEECFLTKKGKVKITK